MIQSPPHIYSRNIARLKTNYPHIWKYLSAIPAPHPGRVVQTHDGRLALQVQNERGRPVSMHDPEESALRLTHYLKEVGEDFFGFVGFLGMGMGYEIMELMKKRPLIQKIAVFELDPFIFYQVLHHVDLTSLLSDFRLILSVGPDPDVKALLKPAVDPLMLETIQVFNHPPSFRLSPGLYGRLKEEVFERVNYYNVEGGTKMARGRLFFENQMTHLQFLHKNYFLESLTGVFKGCPAILVSGGPSLNQNMHLLEKAVGKAVILAVDSVFPLLLKHRIVPDFVTAIDALDLTYEKIAGYTKQMAGVNLICKTGVNMKTPNLCLSDRVFFAFSDSHMDAWFMDLFGCQTKTEGAGTVAHLNLMAATLMGCAPIIFVGQDLAFSGMKSHASGLFLGGEERMKKEVKDHDMILSVAGIDGKEVVTSRAYLNMKHHFEYLIGLSPNRYINATAQGAHIEGTETMPLDQVFKEFLHSPLHTQKILSGVFFHKTSDTAILEKLKPIREEAMGLLVSVREAKSLGMRIKETIQTLFRKKKRYHSFSELPHVLKKEIEQVQNLHGSIKQNAFIWELLKDTTINGIKETGRRLHRLRLYQDDPSRFGQWLDEFLSYLMTISDIQEEALSTFTAYLDLAVSRQEQERGILLEMKQVGETAPLKKSLARLYFEAGKYALSKPLLEKLLEESPDDPEIHFQNGCVEAYLSDLSQAFRSFDRALALAPAMEAEKERFLSALADAYLKHTDYFMDVDRNTAIRMCRKGLELYPGHKGLGQRIGQLCPEVSPPPNTYFAQNMALLQIHHPQVFQAMEHAPSKPIGALVPGDHGFFKLVVPGPRGEDIVFHEDLETETNTFYETLKEGATGFVALLGMGLGYTAMRILKERPLVRKLALFELSFDIFRSAMERVDLSPLLSDPRTILTVGPNPQVPRLLESIIPLLRVENTYTLNTIPAFHLDLQGYSRLSEEVFKFANEFNVGGATTLALGEKFTENRLTNLALIPGDSLLEDLENAFKGVPAFIVAGGPSLDKNIHHLKEAKNRSVIIAVDTVLPALMQQGILPDFLCSIDSQDLTFEKISHVVPMVSDLFLITMPWVNQKFPRVFPAKERFWSFSGHYIDQWMNRLLGGRPFARGAGTVAHMNMIAALVMGCSPIVFVGQDLAYTNRACHAANTVLTEKKRMEGVLKDNFMLPGINGGTVLSSRSFHTMKIYFEELIKKNPDRRFINATEGGAHIEGTESLSLSQVIATSIGAPVPVIPIVNTRLGTMKKRELKPLLDGIGPLLNESGKIIGNIKEMDLMIHQTALKIRHQKQSGRPIKTLNDLHPEIREKLLIIDAEQQKLDLSADLWRLVEDLTLKGLKESERMRHDIFLMGNAPAHYIPWLLKNMERISYINSVRLNALTALQRLLSSLSTDFQKERALLKSIKETGETDPLLLERAFLLFDRKDFLKALPLLKKTALSAPDHAGIQFRLGSIYALRSQEREAQSCFEKARAIDPGYGERINLFYRDLSNAYLEHAIFFKDVDDHSFRLMVARGLAKDPLHPVLKSEWAAHVAGDQKRISGLVEKGSIKDVGHDIRVWRSDIMEHGSIERALTSGEKAAFFCFYGNLLVAEGTLEGAFSVFKEVVSLSPDTPRFHLFLADVCFALNRFEDGVAALSRAVSLDRSYAKCWENMGDNLRRRGQTDEAIAAYELCYKSLPEHTIVLKKMGECYRELGNTAAAEEAFRFYRLKQG